MIRQIMGQICGAELLPGVAYALRIVTDFEANHE